ncbi:MAG: hypothetical protein ABII82_17325 [Verrucomicrobiota bacterium]
MHYALYFLGFFLLCLPGAFVLQRKCRFQTLGEITDKRHLWWAWVHGLNLLDIVRAFSGVMLMQMAIGEILPESGGMVIMASVGLVCLIGYAMQQFFYRCDDDQMVMPVFFLAGAALAMAPIHLALMVLAMGVTTAVATRTIYCGLIASMLASGGLGMVFRADMPAMAMLGGLCGFTLLVSLLLHRDVVLTLSTHRIYRRQQVSDSVGALR